MHWAQFCTHVNKVKWAADRPKSKGKPGPSPITPAGPTANLSTILGNDHPGRIYGWNATIGSKNSHQYHPDTGANMSMSGTREHFFDFIPCQKEPVSGIGGTLYATGVGKVAFKSTVNGESHTIVIGNCLYVPGITSNLVSVSSLGKKGYSCLFNTEGTISTRDGEVVALASMAPLVYMFSPQRLFSLLVR